jgi:hypothetical protein
MMARYRCGNENRENWYWKRKEGAEYAMRREKQLSIMWNGFSEMRERERKERGGNIE